MNELELTQAQKELAKYIKKGECILFLGAGAHTPPKNQPYVYPEEDRPPLGGDLSEKLAEEFGYKSKFPNESPRDLQRVSLYIETSKGLGRKTLVDSLETHLRNRKKPSPALRMLAGLPFKIIVTTNFDCLLESALRRLDKEPSIFVYDPDRDKPTLDVDEDPTEMRPILFKMHGDLNQRPSIVITDEDYITFVQRMSDKDALHPVPETIRYRMQRWPTLFVGYSLRDYNLRLLFRTLRWRLDSSKFPTSFSIDNNPDQLILEVWQNERRFITFVTLDLWTFVPWLFKEVNGQEYQL